MWKIQRNVILGQKGFGAFWEPISGLALGNKRTASQLHRHKTEEPVIVNPRPNLVKDDKGKEDARITRDTSQSWRQASAAVTPKVPSHEVHKALSQHILVDGFHYVQDLEKSHGSWLHSAGHDILDGYTSFSTMPVGYNHPKLWTKEFQARIMPAALNNVANSDMYTTYFAEFVQAFARTLPEAFRSHVFFVAGGALAIENALKTAFDWKVRKNLAAGKGEKGSKIIHFREAFHGRSGYTMSMTNTDIKKIMFYPKFEWPRISNPKLAFHKGKVTQDTLEEVIRVEKQAIQQIHQAVRENPDEIAALIVETIQGEGGDNHFRPEFFRELRKLADSLGFLLIFDEVQTGFGTTGKWWAFENYGVMPDIFAFGKKSQVCGIAATNRIDDVDNVFKVSSRINSTWGGNLVDMVRAQKYIEIMEEEDVLDNAKKVGDAILRGLIKFESKYEGQVTNARGKGMFIAVDLPSTEIRNEALKTFRDFDILVLSSGSRSLRLRPTLTMTEEEGLELVSRMEKGLDKVLVK